MSEVEFILFSDAASTLEEFVVFVDEHSDI